ncbi:CDK-activating kinase assembly factor MAT1-domain-containing protein [Apiosordaria backusii]|uniref:RNA polymerase II transcription factor B subunit 3 n=1 Tax=Apiosordaria backusii TaxID=314023 RepID=A0AA40E9P6_9PEZI|nr:CDK-activating kinase assembly factor MAT1-domain-containing protein [Apiosordaria backusii]
MTSRKPPTTSSRGGGVTPAPTTTSSGLPTLSSDDMCPVCKTIRYLNRDMEFLINPECYHSMCSACVNRLFNEGPNQCPYAGCHRTLRRKGFRSAFFGDLSVEREVDIRRRVSQVFNQAEDDFQTLRDYNNYLQMVEDLTFDLVNGDEATKRKAEGELQQWEAEHKADIERNKRVGREQDEQSRRRLAAEREAARQRRLDAIKEAEEEKLEKIKIREAEIDNLERGGALPDQQRVQLKRRGKQAVDAAANLATSASITTTTAATDSVGKLSIRGLKEKKKEPKPEGPYDPFGGLDLQPSRYKIHPGLKHPSVEKYRLDQGHVTGGYSFEEYTSRAMFEAFAGLGVFIEDEKEVGVGLSASEVVGMGAAMAAVGGDGMDLD